ncbi:MAG: hypothetical protein KGI52_16340 [Burkholderiales bacterium]|nr:hypothetical protein [Burkholderiales bacterium]
MNRHPVRSVQLALAASALMCLVQAQASPASGTEQAFQCTNSHGQITYQQMPCSVNAAKVIQVDASDRRTEAQHRQAGAALGQQTQLAQKMSDHRQRMERQAASNTREARALTVQAKPTPQPKLTTTSSKSNLISRKRDFRAVYKPPKKARKS